MFSFVTFLLSICSSKFYSHVLDTKKWNKNDTSTQSKDFELFLENNITQNQLWNFRSVITWENEDKLQ